MRVFVVEPDGAGGMVHYAFQLCTAMTAEGADVTLVTGRHYELGHLPHSFTVEPRMNLWPAVEEQGAPAGRIRRTLRTLGRKIRRVFRGIRYFVEWARLTRHLLTQRPDMVQFAIIRFPFQVIFLRRLRRAGITLVQICHEFEPRERGVVSRALNRRLSRAVYQSFDLIYLHGDENRARFLGRFDIDPDRVRVIHHANEAMFLDLVAGDAAPRPSVPLDRPVALFFGGLRPSKGLDDLVQAWGRVVAEIDAHLLITGYPAGVEPAELEGLAADLGIGGSVTIDAGYLPLERVAGVFEAADLVVLPYRSATASGVLQLAYAFGRPVVATATGALAEDVVDGETGHLVPPADPDALARAIVKILTDPAEATRMGSASRLAADRFGWAPVARTILDDAQEASA